MANTPMANSILGVIRSAYNKLTNSPANELPPAIKLERLSKLSNQEKKWFKDAVEEAENAAKEARKARNQSGRTVEENRILLADINRQNKKLRIGFQTIQDDMSRRNRLESLAVADLNWNMILSVLDYALETVPEVPGLVVEQEAQEESELYDGMRRLGERQRSTPSYGRSPPPGKQLDRTPAEDFAVLAAAADRMSEGPSEREIVRETSRRSEDVEQNSEDARPALEEQDGAAKEKRDEQLLIQLDGDDTRAAVAGSNVLEAHMASLGMSRVNQETKTSQGDTTEKDIEDNSDSKSDRGSINLGARRKVPQNREVNQQELELREARRILGEVEEERTRLQRHLAMLEQQRKDQLQEWGRVQKQLREEREEKERLHRLTQRRQEQDQRGRETPNRKGKCG